MDYHSLFLFLSEHEEHEVRSQILGEIVKFDEYINFSLHRDDESPYLLIRKNDMFLIYKDKECFDLTFFIYTYEEILSSLSILFKEGLEVTICISDLDDLLSEDVLNSCIDHALLNDNSESFCFFAELLNKFYEKN